VKTPAPKEFLRYSHLGVQFAVILFAFAWGGRWLVRRGYVGEWAFLLAIFAGAAIGFYLLYREIPRE